MANHIENKIKLDKWSLDVIVSYMKVHHFFNNDGFSSITTHTIYNAIRLGIINVKIEDTKRMKYKPEYEYNDSISLPISKTLYSIENRPEIIDNRSTFGQFELYTVVGINRDKHGCLLTITERKTKFKIIFKLSSKNSENVVNKIN